MNAFYLEFSNVVENRAGRAMRERERNIGKQKILNLTKYKTMMDRPFPPFVKVKSGEEGLCE